MISSSNLLVRLTELCSGDPGSGSTGRTLLEKRVDLRRNKTIESVTISDKDFIRSDRHSSVVYHREGTSHSIIENTLGTSLGRLGHESIGFLVLDKDGVIVLDDHPLDIPYIE
ncbi:hypothetical protein Tco_0906167 [Tanacetum coccineum]